MAPGLHTPHSVLRVPHTFAFISCLLSTNIPRPLLGALQTTPLTAGFPVILDQGMDVGPAFSGDAVGGQRLLIGLVSRL